MKGILMTPDNIRATKENRKTATRRFDGLYEINKEPDKWISYEVDGIEWGFKNKSSLAVYRIRPRYRKGEVVYIKEPHYRYGRWLQSGVTKTGKPSWDFIPSNLDIIFVHDTTRKPVLMPKDRTKTGWYLRSPLFLPADLARDFTRITEVMPQRLQDITEEQARAEGAPYLHVIENPRLLYPDVRGYRRGFLFLWDSINAKRGYPWSGNWWVWAYQFCRCTREGGCL